MSTARTLTRAEREAALTKMESEVEKCRAYCLGNLMDSGHVSRVNIEYMRQAIDSLAMARDWHEQLCAAEDADLQRNTCH
jgi:hypothetical protein